MVHSRRNDRATAGSAWKMLTGMARSEVGAPSGFRVMTYCALQKGENKHSKRYRTSRHGLPSRKMSIQTRGVGGDSTSVERLFSMLCKSMEQEEEEEEKEDEECDGEGMEIEQEEEEERANYE